MAHQSSFHKMINGMQTNLMAFAMKLTTNRDEACDLVQDTTLKALSNEDKFTDASNPKAWMLTIMRNIFINNYRKSVRENTTIDTSEDLYRLNISQDSGLSSPDGLITVKEISSIIEQLPEDYRRPFNMHMAGYKYEEISERLGMPMGTVKSRIYGSRQRLREILKDCR